MGGDFDLFVEVALDTLLGSFLKLFLVDFYFRDLLVGGNQLVQTIAVLLHDVLQILLREAHVPGLVHVGVN